MSKDQHPEAAEAATDLGADDGIDEMGKVFAWAVVAIVSVTLIAVSVAIWGG